MPVKERRLADIVWDRSNLVTLSFALHSIPIFYQESNLNCLEVALRAACFCQTSFRLESFLSN